MKMKYITAALAQYLSHRPRAAGVLPLNFTTATRQLTDAEFFESTLKDFNREAGEVLKQLQDTAANVPADPQAELKEKDALIAELQERLKSCEVERTEIQKKLDERDGDSGDDDGEEPEVEEKPTERPANALASEATAKAKKKAAKK